LNDRISNNDLRHRLQYAGILVSQPSLSDYSTIAELQQIHTRGPSSTTYNSIRFREKEELSQLNFRPPHVAQRVEGRTGTLLLALVVLLVDKELESLWWHCCGSF
jgi:hypothetical protein